MKATNIGVCMVGSIGIDAIRTRDEDRQELLGGSLPYATVASSFFARTGAVGVVGDDFPRSFEKRWGGCGVDLEGVQHQPGATFRWACKYDDNMIDRETLRTELGVFADFLPVLPRAYQQAPFLMLGNIQPELQLHVLKQALKPRFVALDTMNLWIEIARPALLRVIKRVDLLTVNDGEARLLTGKWNLFECAERLLRMGPSYVLVKKGEHGALLFAGKRAFIIPAYPVKRVVDPTGAGDTYAGAMMGYLARRGRVSAGALCQALVYASAVASFGVEGFSLERLEKLTLRRIEARVGELRRMVVA